MKNINPPTGMRDILPEDFFLRDTLISAIRRVYESYGYVPIDTPAAERIEFLAGKAGEEAEQLMFKILKRGAKLAGSGAEELADMALRYDLTVSLCRFYASNHARLPQVFRRYQVAPVWRADRPQHGRFREFYQCDVDIIGEPGNLPECEVILATVEALRAVGIADYFVKLSDRQLLPTILAALGLSEAETRRAMVSIDKLDKIGLEGVLAEAGEYLPAESQQRLRQFLAQITAGAELPLESEALGQWGQRCAEALTPVLDNLRSVAQVIAEVADPPIQIAFWPSLARGMAYYTGPIFEIWDRQHPFSLAGGGRYDGLIGVFLGRSVPACGFSIGFERILAIMREQGQTAGRQTKAEVLVALRDPGQQAVGLRVAGQLRAAGLPTEVYPHTSKIKRQFEHAAQLGIPWVVVLHGADDEICQHELIRMSDRSRVQAPWGEILKMLRAGDLS